MDFMLFRPDQPPAKGGGELIDAWEKGASSFLWLHITGPLPESHLQMLEEKFSLHPLALQDAARDRHPPKIEAFDAFTFLLFKVLPRKAEVLDLATIQLALFVSDRFLVTRTSVKAPSVDRLAQEVEESDCPHAAGPDALAVRLIRILIDEYLAILLRVELELEETEETLIEAMNDDTLAKLTHGKAELRRLRRVFSYHEQLLRQLRKQAHPGFQETQTHALTDIFEQQERAASLSQLYGDLASDLIDGYLSLSSHRLNQIMKILTVITAIFVPLSFLAGIYGMNFQNMPELQSKGGYFILLGVMLAIATVLLTIFRRKRWI